MRATRVVASARSRASAKAKGRRFQQGVVARLKEAIPTLTGNDIMSTPMGCPGDDVLMSPKALEHLPYQFELKCCERVSVWGAIDQLERRGDPRLTPCVVLGRNHARPLAVLPMGHWLNALRAAAAAADGSAAAPDVSGCAEFPDRASVHDFAEALAGDATERLRGGDGGDVGGSGGERDVGGPAVVAEPADFDERTLALLAERAWHGERAEMTDSGAVVLDSGATESWWVQPWAKPRLNLWRVFAEAEAAAAGHAKSARCGRVGTREQSAVIATPPPRPLVMFARPGVESAPVFASVHFDVWLDVVVGVSGDVGECGAVTDAAACNGSRRA